jgi:hypothetical protein
MNNIFEINSAVIYIKSKFQIFLLILRQTSAEWRRNLSVRIENERLERERRDRIERAKRQWTENSSTQITNENFNLGSVTLGSVTESSTTLKVNFLPLQRSLRFNS